MLDLASISQYGILGSYGRFITCQVDGKKWHSTQAQMQKDYLRERALQKNSFHVMRFTALEAIHTPTECLIEIYNQYCRLNAPMEVVNG